MEEGRSSFKILTGKPTGKRPRRRWEQFFSNLLNVNQSTSHEGSEVYTAEPDIPEPSLIEVELAIEKLRRYKLPE